MGHVADLEDWRLRLEAREAAVREREKAVRLREAALDRREGGASDFGHDDVHLLLSQLGRLETMVGEMTSEGGLSWRDRALQRFRDASNVSSSGQRRPTSAPARRPPPRERNKDASSQFVGIGAIGGKPPTTPASARRPKSGRRCTGFACRLPADHKRPQQRPHFR